MQLDSIRRTMSKCKFELLGLLTWEGNLGRLTFKATEGERTVKISLRQSRSGKSHIETVAAGASHEYVFQGTGLKIRLSDLEEFVKLYGNENK